MAEMESARNQLETAIESLRQTEENEEAARKELASQNSDSGLPRRMEVLVQERFSFSLAMPFLLVGLLLLFVLIDVGVITALAYRRSGAPNARMDD